MSLILPRRQLLAAGTFGLAALAAPGTSQLLAARGFTHGVASGEPGHYKGLLWTRYVPGSGDGARLRWQVAETPEFGAIVSEGEAVVTGERDWCVKAVAEGLRPNNWYFYRFTDRAGRHSPVGRTRTLPNSAGQAAKFTLGIFSCSNLPFGFFNAYGHAAARDDIDLMVHLGDYLYEYERGRYPSAGAGLPGRLIDPAGEIVSLADYRLRHAAYRADPDLQRLHQRFPMVAMWDDHESTNDSWAGGAENHQPATEGDWQVRKRAATRAYREWLPVSDEPWKAYRIGDLAHLYRPETRLTARSQPLNLGAALAGVRDVPSALAAFRDGPWRDPARTMFGAEQEKWLADGFRHSARDGVRWQVLAQQVLMGSISLSPRSSEWVGADAAPEVKQRAQVGLAASRIGLPFNFDMWDGYPAARERLLRSALDADANLLVLSGDSHNAWAFNLDVGGTPAGVDFGVQSVTSPGYETYLPGVDPKLLARTVVDHNPQLEWADTQHRGYMTLELTPDRATNEWLFSDGVRRRSTRIAGRHRMHVARGSNRLAGTA